MLHCRRFSGYHGRAARGRIAVRQFGIKTTELA
jgi:hypothetical protein